MSSQIEERPAFRAGVPVLVLDDDEWGGLVRARTVELWRGDQPPEPEDISLMKETVVAAVGNMAILGPNVVKVTPEILVQRKKRLVGLSGSISFLFGREYQSHEVLTVRVY